MDFFLEFREGLFGENFLRDLREKKGVEEVGRGDGEGRPGEGVGCYLND